MLTRRGFARTEALLAAAALVAAAGGAFLSLRATVIRDHTRRPAVVVPLLISPVLPPGRPTPPIPAMSERVQYVDRDLAGYDLRDFHFTRCTFRRSDLRGADLRGACFWACDLRETRLDRAKLRGAYYNTLTKWPAGFDPRAAGARLVE